MRAYQPERLREAVTAAKPGGQPVELLLKDGADFRLMRLDWRGGLRYPRLEQIDGSEDRLTAILSAH